MKGITHPRRVVVILAILAATMLLPAATALGADGGTVGLYVQYGDGEIATYCLQTTTPIRYVEALIAAEDMGGYEVTWHEFQGMGKALCGIDRPPLGKVWPGVEGCEAADCFCNPNAFWNYHYLPAGGDWSWSHYGDMNLYNGDVGAFVFGAWGTQPETLMTLDDICVEEEEFVPEPGGIKPSPRTPGTVASPAKHKTVPPMSPATATALSAALSEGSSASSSKAS